MAKGRASWAGFIQIAGSGAVQESSSAGSWRCDRTDAARRDDDA